MRTPVFLFLVVALGATSLACQKERKQPRPQQRPAATASGPKPQASDEAEGLRNAALKTLNGGDAEAGLRQLEEAHKRFPKNAAIVRDLGVVLSNGAVKAAKAGDLVRADTLSARALALDDKEENRRRVRINVLHRLAKDSDSDARKKSLFEEILALDDKDVGALLRLGEFADEDNALKEALDYFKRAQAAARSPIGGLDNKIARLEKQAAVEGDFDDASETHFQARFEGYAQEKLAWTALNILEEAYFSVGDKLGLHADEKITVVIYTGGKYAQATGMPDWSAGAYDGKIRVREGDILGERGRLKDTLFHEYTHAILARAVKGPVPTWFNEGLAEVMEPGFPGPDARLIAQAKAAGALIPLHQLEGSFVGIADARTARLAYAEAAAAVEAMIAKQGLYEVSRIFQEMNDGKSFAEAYQAVFYESLEAFGARFVDGL
jgi:hypothetical protein